MRSECELRVAHLARKFALFGDRDRRRLFPRWGRGEGVGAKGERVL